jgi:hypothetical protein
LLSESLIMNSTAGYAPPHEGDPVTAPGWYPDPSGAPNRRYFDGNKWTEQHAPLARKKRRVWPWVLLTVFIVGALIAGGMYVAFKYTTGNAAELPAAEAGSTVRDGKLEFVVNSVEVAEDWSGDPRPQGEWVVADITVTNLGDEGFTFDCSNQLLIDSQGHEHAGSYDAAEAIAPRSSQFELDPGESADVKVPFDVPTGATADRLVLRETMISRGAAVKVS